MAVRLNVVMVQSPPASANGQRLAEKVVGKLIGLPSMDLILVGPLDQIDAASTDYLTLDSLTGDVALLDWRSPESSLSSLQNLGIEGTRTPHAGDPSAESGQATQRRFYLFDLNQFSDGQDVCTALGQLLKSRQVRTFSLLPVAPAQSTSNQPKQSSRPDSAALSDRQEPAKATETADTSTPAVDTSPTSSLDLDELVDQLDLLDP